MESVLPSKDLESLLRPHLPTSLKVLSLTQVGQRIDLPGLKILVNKDRDQGSSMVMVAMLEHERDDRNVIVFCGKKEEDIRRLKQALHDHFDWTLPNLFGGIPQHLLSTMDEMFEYYGSAGMKVPCNIHYLPSLEDLKFDWNSIEKAGDVRIGLLGAEHVDKVVENWKFSDPEYIKRIGKKMRFMLEKKHCFGVFGKENGELRSWMCVRRYGGMGVLFTPPEYRRRGYSKMCVAAVSRHLILNLGILPYVYIEHYNKLSAQIFTDLGFVLAERADWIHFEPKVE